MSSDTGVDCHTKHMDGKSEVIFAFGESWEHFIDYVIWVNHGENRGKWWPLHCIPFPVVPPECYCLVGIVV